ncbi:MAG: signal recognition particle-docking protein FtsY [Bacteroidetes bacterium]|nr:signal recognition particle-docking protein FtsY [Bacteroidota bacterium]
MGLFDKIKQKVASAVEAVSFTKLKEGLEKTRNAFVNRLKSVLGSGRKIDASLMNDIEEILLTSDIGVDTSVRIMNAVKERAKRDGFEDSMEIYTMIKQEILTILTAVPTPEDDAIFAVKEDNLPHTIMVVGVNGVGKTTTIGKLAHNYRNAGKKVIIGAADTFRAAANEQLEIWAERAGVDIVQQAHGADPAAVAYDTLKAAIARKSDVVIIDTAGRLHNKANLMAELEKISRVMRKLKVDAPNEVFLTLDATTGQNALQQAKEFAKVSKLTGLVLTKLDGTAKGGIIIAITNELKLPVRYIGVGEKIDDLQPFNPVDFVEALFEEKA